jgi:hypothetical protein
MKISLRDTRLLRVQRPFELERAPLRAKLGHPRPGNTKELIALLPVPSLSSHDITSLLRPRGHN